ncbi:YciI family protein [Polymorphobacter arshaanensis]|uniref:YciI family protein n=1 Tax=Glacieibacterium arshaanense TaxID=2511025 RepID=A0A4Y9ELH4_9SPHN|nr:YciI family protein [Polymorphobacter arshaanensis]TFU01389.1 YciI family protein [Polymorphobacter arshaanensis]
MSYFAIHCIDKPDSADLRAATRPEHLAYIGKIVDSVLVAGPLLGLDGAPIGSLLIIDFADRKAAIQFAADDPYALAGLFASVAVTAWKKVFPAD